MKRPDWQPEGYRPCSPLTEEGHATARRALAALIEGRLTRYWMGCGGSKLQGCGAPPLHSTVGADCESEEQAIEDAIARFGDSAGTIWIRRVEPSGRRDWFRPAGIGCAVDLRPGLVDPSPRQDPGPWVKVDPSQIPLALELGA